MTPAEGWKRTLSRRCPSAGDSRSSSWSLLDANALHVQLQAVYRYLHV